MDPKKQQNLTPELKQIYERVMNTQVAPKPATPAAPQTPPAAPPQQPQPVTAQPAMPQQPPAPPAMHQEIPQQPSTAPQVPQATGVPPVKPLSASPQPFVFSGGGQAHTQASDSNQGFVATNKPKKKTSTLLIGVLVVVLVAVWTLFWVKFFGLI